MTLDELRALLDRGEGQFFEHKSARIHPRELAHHLIAFANADGGTLVVGIENDQTFTGTNRYVGKINQFVQAGIDYCSPPVRFQHAFVDCTNDRGQPDRVLVLTVQQSDRVHTHTGDKVFLRVGDQSRELNFQERLELLYDKGETNFEAVSAPGASVDDLDVALLEEYRQVLATRGTVEDLLLGRGLAERTAGSLAINHAGVLLFARQPTRWLPRAEVRFLRYEGTTAETGPRMNVVKDTIIDGPLPRQLREAFEIVGAQLRDFTRLVPGGVFETSPEYPEFVWQEAITNAVAHRSYSLSGVSVHARMFEDRLEVESPGKLPGIVRTHNIRRVHFARNPRIARVLTELRFVRDVGEGVDRMYEEMAAVELPPPEFRELDYAVIVTLRNDLEERQAPGRREVGVSERLIDVAPHVARKLNVRQIAALRFLRTHDAIRTADLIRMFPNVTERTALTDLRGLVSLGLLERTGRTRGASYHTGGVVYRLDDEG